MPVIVGMSGYQKRLSQMKRWTNPRDLREAKRRLGLVWNHWDAMTLANAKGDLDTQDKIAWFLNELRKILEGENPYYLDY